MVGGPSPADGGGAGGPTSTGAGDGGGAGGSTSTGTGASHGDASAAGGSGGHTGVGGNGNTGGKGGATGIDGGAGQGIPPKDASADSATGGDAGGCPLDCNHLPNLQPNLSIKCVQGKCQLPPNACLPNFANCSGSANTGCETDLSNVSNCGSCGSKCTATQSCRQSSLGGFFCQGPCQAPNNDTCGDLCVDLQTDLNNCGTCGFECFLPNADYTCQSGKCISLGCNDPSWADCTSDAGCETLLGQPDNCGGCGDPACALANTLFTCADRTGCDAAVCAPGFGNCSTASADCETDFSSPPASGNCLPHYVNTLSIASGNFDNARTAFAPDGSFFLAGNFSGAVDFDPSANRDVRVASDKDGYITKFNADGSYAWTAVFTGRGDILLNGLAVTADGNVVAAGFYMDTVDLDPGPASSLSFTASADRPDPFVVELTPTGTLAWGGTFAGSADSHGAASDVAVDATGAVYVAGSFGGSMDFDPGAGTNTLGSTNGSGFVAKLTASGSFAWARTFDDGACGATLASTAVATDGTVWATGLAQTGDGCTLAPVTGKSPRNNLLLARLTAGGDTLSVRTIGNQLDGDGFALAASPDGSMYLAGHGTGETELDPGPPPVERWLGSSGGAFILKLDATGALIWVRSINGPSYLSSMAATADGGALMAGLGENNGMFVTRWTAVGASAWSFEVGPGNASALSVSSAGGSFLVAGTSNGGTVDFDPGPGIDPLFGEISFVSRFTF